MFEGLLEQGNEMQDKMHQELIKIAINVEMEGVSLSGDGSGQMKDISIADELMHLDQKEKLEDLLIMCLQSFNAKVAEEGQKVSEKMLTDLLPGGFGNIFG